MSEHRENGASQWIGAVFPAAAGRSPSLPAAAVRRLNEQLALEWIYNSNAIEGSTLTLRETQLILESGLTIGGKSLREHFEVINPPNDNYNGPSMTIRSAHEGHR